MKSNITTSRTKFAFPNISKINAEIKHNIPKTSKFSFFFTILISSLLLVIFIFLDCSNLQDKIRIFIANIYSLYISSLSYETRKIRRKRIHQPRYKSNNSNFNFFNLLKSPLIELIAFELELKSKGEAPSKSAFPISRSKGIE